MSTLRVLSILTCKWKGWAVSPTSWLKKPSPPCSCFAVYHREGDSVSHFPRLHGPMASRGSACGRPGWGTGEQCKGKIQHFSLPGSGASLGSVPASWPSLLLVPSLGLPGLWALVTLPLSIASQLQFQLSQCFYAQIPFLLLLSPLSFSLDMTETIRRSCLQDVEELGALAGAQCPLHEGPAWAVLQANRCPGPLVHSQPHW